MTSFDTIEVRPCRIVDRYGIETVEQCAPEDANLWSIYGHRVTGGLDRLEDFPTEAEAEAFAAKLLRLINLLAAITEKGAGFHPLRWAERHRGGLLSGSIAGKPPRTRR
jgi:hypothetical protein